MRLIGLTLPQFEAILTRFNRQHRTSLHLTEHGSWKNTPKTGGVKRPWVQGQLKLHSAADPYHRRKMPYYSGYTSYGGGSDAPVLPVKVPGRMPFVCWHGCRDLFKAVFAKYPGATIRTGKMIYRGQEHFERTFESTDVNIGSSLYPLSFSQACDCTENGEDWTGLAEKIVFNQKLQRLQGREAVNS